MLSCFSLQPDAGDFDQFRAVREEFLGRVDTDAARRTQPRQGNGFGGIVAAKLDHGLALDADLPQRLQDIALEVRVIRILEGRE